uniref:Chromo domain-containing protein n=1 Tax=Leptobrachium leishanense TaxID=445787 RepID=A0A8C5QGD2_9ANUR
MIPGLMPLSSVPDADSRLATLQEVWQLARKTLRAAQDKYKTSADRSRSVPPPFQIGDRVLLSTRNLRLHCPLKKLGPHFIDPFEITHQVNPVAFRLALPPTYRIHLVFHVSLLKRIPPDEFPGRSTPSCPPVLVGDELEYEVARVLDSRFHRGTLQYLILWKGFGPEELSWEPASQVHAPSCLRAFHCAQPGWPGPCHVRRPLFQGGVLSCHPTTSRDTHLGGRLMLGEWRCGAPRGLSAGWERPRVLRCLLRALPHLFGWVGVAMTFRPLWAWRRLASDVTGVGAWTWVGGATSGVGPPVPADLMGNYTRRFQLHD